MVLLLITPTAMWNTTLVSIECGSRGELCNEVFMITFKRGKTYA